MCADVCTLHLVFHTVKSAQRLLQRAGNVSEADSLANGELIVNVAQHLEDILKQAHVKRRENRNKEYNIGQNTILHNGTTAGLRNTEIDRERRQLFNNIYVKDLHLHHVLQRPKDEQGKSYAQHCAHM